MRDPGDNARAVGGDGDLGTSGDRAGRRDWPEINPARRLRGCSEPGAADTERDEHAEHPSAPTSSCHHLEANADTSRSISGRVDRRHRRGIDAGMQARGANPAAESNRNRPRPAAGADECSG